MFDYEHKTNMCCNAIIAIIYLYLSINYIHMQYIRFSMQYMYIISNFYFFFMSHFVFGHCFFSLLISILQFISINYNQSHHHISYYYLSSYIITYIKDTLYHSLYAFFLFTSFSFFFATSSFVYCLLYFVSIDLNSFCFFVIWFSFLLF